MLINLATPESLDAQVNVAQQAFSILADMNVFPSTSPSDPVVLALESGPTFAAVVSYMGECSGSLRIDCTPSIAFAFTQRICGIDTPREFNADVSDAIGELINTIGGNLKGLLPAHTRLNIPKVFAHSSAAADEVAGTRLSCLNFDSEFGAFRLLLLAPA